MLNTSLPNVEENLGAYKILKEKDKGTNILFVTQRLSDFVEMRRAAMLLKPEGYTCLFLFCGVGQQKYDDEVVKALSDSIELGEIDGKIIKPNRILRYLSPWLASIFLRLDYIKVINRILQAKPVSTKPKIFKNSGHFKQSNRYTKGFMHHLKRVIIFLRRLTIIKIPMLPLYYFVHQKLYKQLVKLFNINLIILPEDIVGHVSPLLIKAGLDAKIPSLILPYTIANQEEAFQSLKASEDLWLSSSFLNRIVGFLFPAWVMKQDGFSLLRLPPGHILGHKITKCSPPDPWMMNSGAATIIAVENERMLEYYHQSGIPLKKLSVVGACSDDQLAYYLLAKETERKLLYQELNLTSDKPILLIGGFPNQLVGNPPGFDFKDAEEAVDFIAESLKIFESQYTIIIKPHPNYMELGELFARKNYVLTNIDTARLIALSDIYIAFASATIRWAIACGLPCINYDIFYYNFTDYKAVPSVLSVCTKDEFKSAADSFLSNDYLEELRKAAKLEKQKWGLLDGQSGARIKGLVQKLLKVK